MIQSAVFRNCGWWVAFSDHGATSWWHLVAGPPYSLSLSLLKDGQQQSRGLRRIGNGSGPETPPYEFLQMEVAAFATKFRHRSWKLAPTLSWQTERVSMVANKPPCWNYSKYEGSTVWEHQYIYMQGNIHHICYKSHQRSYSLPTVPLQFIP